jgi:hypothetical protein
MDIKTHPTLLSGLLAYYKLEGNVTDSHGTNHGTAEKTISTVAGLLRNCIAFDGNGAPADAIGTCQVLNLGQLLASYDSFSISMWSNPTSISDLQTPVSLCSWEDSAYHAQSRLYIQHVSGASGDIYFVYWGASGGYISKTLTFNAAVWTHWAMTVDYNSGTGITTLNVYKNGYLAGTSSGTIGARKTTTIPLLIGGVPRLYFGANQRMQQVNGKLDEIAIANRAWTYSEVIDLFHSGYPLRYEEQYVDSLQGASIINLPQPVQGASSEVRALIRNLHPSQYAIDKTSWSFALARTLDDTAGVLAFPSLLRTNPDVNELTHQPHPIWPREAGVGSGFHRKGKRG